MEIFNLKHIKILERYAEIPHLKQGSLQELSEKTGEEVMATLHITLDELLSLSNT